MRIPLPRGRFVVLHPLRIGLVLGLVGLLTWAVGAFGAAPVAEAPPILFIPHIVLEDEAPPSTVGLLEESGLITYPNGNLYLTAEGFRNQSGQTLALSPSDVAAEDVSLDFAW